MKLLFSLALVAAASVSGSDVVANALTLVPGGQNIGIEIHPDGLIVSGSYDIKLDKGTYNPTRDSDIRVGDLIFEVENMHITSAQDFVEQFKNYENTKNNLSIRLKRGSNILSRTLRVVKVGANFKTGLFIKERLLGIGTISFYDPETHMYGALGHEIIDQDSKNIVEVESGMIYASTVTGINKSEDGKPGAKVADIDMSDELGVILSNNRYGLYGTYDELPAHYQTMEMANIDEIQLGRAEIWTVTTNNTISKYNIKITNLANQNVVETKGISFQVDDSRLLQISNGIVGGMSGSPIIQNNKLIGAVTHVVVDDVDHGYGIYMQWMVETAHQIYSKVT